MLLVCVLIQFGVLECLTFVSEIVQVRTSVGIFWGESMKKDGVELHVFKGIRYGAPPTGRDRFRKPRPFVQSANAVIKATSYGATCPQLHKIPEVILPRSEDCLFLNIWTPKSNEFTKELSPKSSKFVANATKLLPVMFWIYGGGFQLGTASTELLTPWPLAVNGQVVVVTFNYRGGPLGFLYDGSEEAPGNMGLYDQLLALKWVNDNIRSFGGDSKRITIFGLRSGSFISTF